MKIDIFEYRYSDLSPSEAFSLHNSMFKNYMHFERMRHKNSFFLTRYLGYFLGPSIVLWLLSGKSLSPFYLFSTACLGMGCLLNFFIIMRMLNEFDREISHIENEGEKLETDCSQVIESKPFSRSKGIKSIRYKGALLESLFPFYIIAISTGAVIALLVSPFGKWLSIAIISFSIFTTIFLNIRLIKSIKNAILIGNQWPLKRHSK